MNTPHTEALIKAVLLFLFAAMIFGCATTAEHSGEQPLPVEPWQTRAEQAQASGDLRQALLSWEVLAALLPTDTAAAQQVERLRLACVRQAEDSFQQGLALLGMDDAQGAQKAFLAALYLDPSHPSALPYLRAQMGGKDFTLHTLQEGESLSLVAKQYYDDVYRFDLVAYYNDLDPNEPVHPGMVLTLPSMKGVEMRRVKPDPALAQGTLKKAPEYPESAAEEMTLVSLDTREVEEMVVEMSLIRRMLDQARKALHSQQYPLAAAQAEKILDIDQTNSEARYLVNAANYQLGRQHIDSRRFDQALRFLDKVATDYQDTSALRTTCQHTLAETHYRTGVKWFAEEKLELAVTEFQTTLQLNPDHPKARQDLEEIQGLIRKLKRFE